MRLRFWTLLLAVAVGTLVSAQGYQRVSFNALSNYEYELPDPLDPKPVSVANVIPASVKALHGKMVSVDGFMLPLDLNQEGVSLFMLNASIDMCYFGAPVRMNEWILVRMKTGKRAKFTHLGMIVKGRLEVGEEMKNGRVASLYRLEADSVEIEDGR
ncbi:MAG: DUF3299 domain-containing protein [Acidobacteria bacterium]|nr:DUF3299 domain-containing protein [Acidobacteriota bacterium]